MPTSMQLKYSIYDNLLPRVSEKPNLLQGTFLWENQNFKLSTSEDIQAINFSKGEIQEYTLYQHLFTFMCKTKNNATVFSPSSFVSIYFGKFSNFVR